MNSLLDPVRPLIERIEGQANFAGIAVIVCVVLAVLFVLSRV